MNLPILLSKQEIENILDFIKPNIHIPPESANSIVKLLKDRYRKQLLNQKVYPEVITELKKLLEKNYRESQIHPGESIGILAAQSIGERQTQNSIAYDEEIIIKENNEIIKIKIGEFIDNYIEYFGCDHRQVQICKNVEIMTISQDEKIKWQEISEVSRHNPKGNLVKVITESGRSVISTLSHSHLKKEKKSVVPVLGSELKLGDRIPIIKRSPICKCERINKIDLSIYDNFIIGPYEYDSDGNIPEDSPTNNNYIYYNSQRFSRYIEVDNLFIWFLGVILGNNSKLCNYSKKIFIEQNNYDEYFFKKIKNICDKYSIHYNIIQPGKFFFQSLQNDLAVIYEIESDVFVNFINCLCNNNNIIPDFIFGLKKYKIWLFLNSYFIYDGFNRLGNINQHITFLLTYFGICSSFKLNKILIQQKYVKYFEHTFDLYVPKNNLEDNFHILDDQELNKETIRLLTKLNDCQSNDLELSNIDNDEVLAKFIDNFKQYNIDDMSYHYQVLNSDVVWEKITKLELIEEKDYKFPYVYDFSIKGNETFALFSGIVVHNTLNTFHKAGQSEKSVTVGVPRFQELLNSTKTPKIVNCKIFFNNGNKSIQDLRNTINNNLVCLKIEDIINKITVKMNKKPEKWYKIFKLLYNNNFVDHKHCISINFNSKMLFKYRLNLQDISDKIENNYDDLYCVFSPDEKERIDVFIDTSNIKLSEEKLLFIDQNNFEEIYIEECVLPILEKLIVCGIQGIESIYYTHTDDNEWYVETDGSNFKKLLGHPIIDMSRTQSNNVWDIYGTLGIEAAREFLINEFISIMEGINECHVKLLVEKMTYNGTISSISRYTLKKDESGPLSKASFEESVDNFLKSAFAGDVERTQGVSASIICGKRAKIGTGVMDLKVDLNMLSKAL